MLTSLHQEVPNIFYLYYSNRMCNRRSYCEVLIECLCFVTHTITIVAVFPVWNNIQCFINYTDCSTTFFFSPLTPFPLTPSPIHSLSHAHSPTLTPSPLTPSPLTHSPTHSLSTSSFTLPLSHSPLTLPHSLTPPPISPYLTDYSSRGAPYSRTGMPLLSHTPATRPSSLMMRSRPNLHLSYINQEGL